MTILTAHPDRALKKILDGRIIIPTGHYSEVKLKAYAHGEMPTDKLPQEFIKIELNGSVKSNTHPKGYLYGAIALTIFVKTLGNGVIKNNRLDAILEHLGSIDGIVSEGYYFTISSDNIITPTFVDQASGYSLTTINIEWHTV